MWIPRRHQLVGGERDTSYGGVGSIWSPMPVEYRYAPPYINDPGTEWHFVGGRAGGLHMLAGASPCLIVQGWSWTLGGLESRRTVAVARSTKVEGDLLEGMRTMVVSESGRDTDALASCATSATQFAVLVRALPANRLPGPSEYSLLSIDGSTQVALVNVARRTIPPAWLRDGAGGIRIAAERGGIAIASASGPHLRVAISPALAFPVVRDFELGLPGGQLTSLTGLFVASLRYTGSGLSLALTAERTLPGLGAVSQGVLLRLHGDGAIDTSFGPDGDGIWLSPLDPTHRQFRCAGETTRGIAGREGRRVVLYGVAADGGRNPAFGDPEGGLDGSFGVGGIAEADLGAPLRACVVTGDANSIYAFAQRTPAGGDPQLVGARFAVADGGHDPGFGDVGVAAPALEEPGLEPSDLLLQPPALGWLRRRLRPPFVLVALSRPTAGIDCDSLPSLAAINAENGQRLSSIGYGGVALVSRVAEPALVEPDGSVLATQRGDGQIQLRRLTAGGELGALIDVATPEAGDEIRGLKPLSDGSLLAYGAGVTAGWISKLTSTGALDEDFADAGFFLHDAGIPGSGDVALVIGELADGSLIVQLSAPSGGGELCKLSAAGELISDYGAGELGSSPGHVELQGFLHLLGPGVTSSGVHCFLDQDGQVIVAAISGHDPRGGGAPVTIALRRLTVDGHWDAGFGMGTPTINPPTGAQRVELHRPAGGTRDYSSFQAVGIVRLDSALYLVGTAFAGGGQDAGGFLFPQWPLLVVTRWTSAGVKEPSWPGGFQEGGVDPFLYWSAVDVRQESPTSFLIFGSGGTPKELRSRLADGTITTTLTAERPGPALFRVSHPNGIDTSFGDHGVAVIRIPIPEVAFSIIAGGISGARRPLATIAFTDRGTSFRYGHPPRSMFSGAVRFV
jgi:hypothetical protein